MELLDMERCAGCGREIASTWKYCIHCGRPLRAAPAAETPAVEIPAAKIPAAIRPDADPAPSTRKYDTPFWIGVSMGALGLVLIIYAAIQIYTTYA